MDKGPDILVGIAIAQQLKPLADLNFIGCERGGLFFQTALPTIHEMSLIGLISQPVIYGGRWLG